MLWMEVVAASRSSGILSLAPDAANQSAVSPLSTKAPLSRPEKSGSGGGGRSTRHRGRCGGWGGLESKGDWGRCSGCRNTHCLVLVVHRGDGGFSEENRFSN